MLSRRLAAVFALLGLFILHIFYSGPAAWYLLFAALVFPLASWLFTLPGKRKLTVAVHAPDIVSTGEKAEVHLKITSQALLPPGLFTAVFESQNSINGRAVPKKKFFIYGGRAPNLAIPLFTGECGRLKCAISGIRVYDWLGIFSKKLKNDETFFVNIFPVPKAPSPLPCLPMGDLMGAVVKPKPGGGFAEDYDVRPYRRGDPFNLIHWKLTSKRDDLMSREPLITTRGRALITFDLFGDAPAVDSIFARLGYLLFWLLGFSIHPHLLWYDNAAQREKTVQITSPMEYMAFLTALFSARIPVLGLSVAKNVYDEYTWRTHVER